MLLIGGIFDKPLDYQAIVSATPEAVLAGGLRRAGLDVTTVGHYSPFDPAAYDLIHVHHVGAAMVRLLRADGVPIILTLHSTRANSWRHATLTHAAVARARGLVALSREDKLLQARRFLVRPRLHVVIPNGIDAASFGLSSRCRPALGEPWHLLYVGQLTRPKGVYDLLSVVASLTANGHLVRLTLVHQLPGEIATIRGVASDLCISELLDFAGPCTPQQVAIYLSQAHILTLASRAEALPSVVTEGLLTGIPVVASKVGSILEQLGGFGTVTRPRHAAAFAAAIESIMANYEVFAQQAGAARRHAMDTFNVEGMVSSHLALYDSALTRS
jgi:glycosyltransferase involved in cell wall biosynthesis